MPPTGPRTCSAPGCDRPRERSAGGAYCGHHHAEVRAIRRLLTRLHKPPPRRPAGPAAVHPDPRRDWR